MYVADENIFAITNITPIDPPNSGPNALLIITMEIEGSRVKGSRGIVR